MAIKPSLDGVTLPVVFGQSRSALTEEEESMICTLNKNNLCDYLVCQLNNICPDTNLVKAEMVLPYLDRTLDRQEECFRQTTLVGYHRNGDVYFDHLHTDKYVTFLYFLSNTIWLEGGNISIPSKIMNLIRIISGMFLSFKCELPAHFIIFHAVGTVIGNAKYGDYLVVSQNCTINTGTRPKEVPILGKGLYLGAGAKIIGDKTVGDYVSIGVGATVYNKEIPNNSVVVNEEGKTVIRIRRHEKCMTQNYWNNTI